MIKSSEYVPVNQGDQQYDNGKDPKKSSVSPVSVFPVVIVSLAYAAVCIMVIVAVLAGGDFKDVCTHDIKGIVLAHFALYALLIVFQFLAMYQTEWGPRENFWWALVFAVSSLVFLFLLVLGFTATHGAIDQASCRKAMIDNSFINGVPLLGILSYVYCALDLVFFFFVFWYFVRVDEPQRPSTSMVLGGR